MADNIKNRKNQGPQQNKSQQPAKPDQQFDRSEQSLQGQPDPDRNPDKGKMSNNPQAGIAENDRMKQGNRQGNQPGVSPDFADKAAQQPANDVDDIDDEEDEEADEDKVTQRNPAQQQGRTDPRK